MLNSKETREYPKNVDWDYISKNKILSEEFIREFKDKVSWDYISSHQKLSEDFIKEFKDKVYWTCISKYQKLSEEFIREFQDEVIWISISKYQKLSEEFIREFKDKVYWFEILIYQELSEGLIRDFQDRVCWSLVSRYQDVSKDFREEFHLKNHNSSWRSKSRKWKENYIRNYTEYEIQGGKVIAYKSCRPDGYSCFSFRYLYQTGKEYESHADYNEDEPNSFGLSAWTKEGALRYCSDGKLFKVLIDLDDVACIVQEGNKIRATKIKVLEEIKS